MTLIHTIGHVIESTWSRGTISSVATVSYLMNIVRAALTLLGCSLVVCFQSESPVILPVEVRELIFAGWTLHEYVQFLLVSPELQWLRVTDVTEYGFLIKSFLDMECTESADQKGDEDDDITTFSELRKMDSIYGQGQGIDNVQLNESTIASARALIKLRLESSIGKSEPLASVDKDRLDKVLDEFLKYESLLPDSAIWRQICLAALLENVHPDQFATINTAFAMKYQNDMLRAAATNGDYNQIDALVQKLEIAWIDAAAIMAPSIARSGSVDLFSRVLSHCSLEAFSSFQFCLTLILLNKKDLFQEYMRQLVASHATVNLPHLNRICLACCLDQRVEFVKVLFTEVPDFPTQIELTESLKASVTTGNQSIFDAFLVDLEGSDNESLDVFQIVVLATKYNRLEMVQRMIQKELFKHIYDEDLARIFSLVVMEGRMELMELLLGKGRNGQLLMPNIVINPEYEGVVSSMIHSGRVQVLDLFLRQWAAGDSRFSHFSVGRWENLTLRTACNYGKLELVRYLLRRDEFTGELVFPQVDPAGRDNEPLLNAIRHLEIVQELLSQDDHGNLVHPGVAVTDKVLVRAADGPFPVLAFLLQTVIQEDGSVGFRFPGINVNASRHYLLRSLTDRENVPSLMFLLQRDPLGVFRIPGLQIPRDLVDRLQELGVL